MRWRSGNLSTTRRHIGKWPTTSVGGCRIHQMLLRYVKYHATCRACNNVVVIVTRQSLYGVKLCHTALDAGKSQTRPSRLCSCRCRSGRQRWADPPHSRRSLQPWRRPRCVERKGRGGRGECRRLQRRRGRRRQRRLRQGRYLNCGGYVGSVGGDAGSVGGGGCCDSSGTRGGGGSSGSSRRGSRGGAGRAAAGPDTGRWRETARVKGPSHSDLTCDN